MRIYVGLSVIVGLGLGLSVGLSVGIGGEFGGGIGVSLSDIVGYVVSLLVFPLTPPPFSSAALSGCSGGGEKQGGIFPEVTQVSSTPVCFGRLLTFISTLI